MKSISKTNVSRDVARLIAGDAFGDVDLAAFDELTEGWFNAAYALTLTTGQRVVLKVAPPPDVEVMHYEHDILRAEVQALRLVRAQTDAPVPEVLWFDESRTRVASPLFVMPFVPGTSLDRLRGVLAADQQARIDADLGRHLRAINDISGPSFGLLAPTATRHATWRYAFTELWTAVLADGERRAVALPVTYDDLRAAFTAGLPACDDVVDPRLVYWDLWDGNVLVDPETGALRGMLDLERALWGDPLMENQFTSHERRPALLAAYGRTDLDTASGHIRRAMYTLYLHLVMSIEGVYRQYPDDVIGEWARGQLRDDLEVLRTSQ